MMSSTQPARGMRDFLPEDVRRRDYVVGIIRDVYDRYGFEPLETPAAENIETLLGRYGEEGNKLVFKILKRGEHEASGQADLALRYDLTVPFARVVAEYQSRLPKIFKRYQIQPVWRADRPARGRFREFYQCDIDSIGSTSPVVEAEQIAAVTEILTSLGFSDFIIRINHRQILSAWLNHIAIPSSQHADVLMTIDKFDKVGIEGVDKEFAGKGYGDQQRNAIQKWLDERDVSVTDDWLDSQANGLGAEGASGVTNLREILDCANATGVNGRLRIDPTLARGLSYYTGAIMEINVADLPGSLGAGGRYDNLIGTFSGAEIPACGFSLGLERILVVMHERGMFPERVEQSSVDVVVAALDEHARVAAMETARELRKSGTLRVDLYPDVTKKMEKLFKHVDLRRAKFIAIIGGDEVAAGTVTLRNVATKTKETVPRAEAAEYVKRALSH